MDGGVTPHVHARRRQHFTKPSARCNARSAEQPPGRQRQQPAVLLEPRSQQGRRQRIRAARGRRFSEGEVSGQKTTGPTIGDHRKIPPLREGFFISGQSVSKRKPAPHLMRGGDQPGSTQPTISCIRSKLKDEPATETALCCF